MFKELTEDEKVSLILSNKWYFINLYLKYLPAFLLVGFYLIIRNFYMELE